MFYQDVEDRSPGIHKRHRSIRDILPKITNLCTALPPGVCNKFYLQQKRFQVKLLVKASALKPQNTSARTNSRKCQLWRLSLSFFLVPTSEHKEYGEVKFFIFVLIICLTSRHLLPNEDCIAHLNMSTTNWADYCWRHLLFAFWISFLYARPSII
jgi:hypothetical protein